MKNGLIALSILAGAGLLLLYASRSDRQNLWALGEAGPRPDRIGYSGGRPALPEHTRPVFSETNADVYLGIDGVGNYFNPGVTAAIQSDERLLWGLFCSTGDVRAYYPSRREYSIRFAMTGPDGKWIPKTALGEEYGAKFDRILAYWQDASSGSRLDRGPPDAPTDACRPSAAPGPPALTGIRPQLLRTAEELFHMGQPGMYTLYVQVQIKRPMGVSGPDAGRLGLVRFHPVVLKIERKALKQAGGREPQRFPAEVRGK